MNPENRLPLISVIVPVYNVEKYLEKCVDSILRQTLDDIEIILVDDGSTDHSGDMCDAYLRDPRVRVIHQKNGGLSKARNAGVEIAKADYIGFVDSDDYIAKDMYELLYQNIVEAKADISFCGIYNVYASGVRPSYLKTEGKFTADAKGAIELVLRAKYASVSAVNKLYKKTLLKRHPFPVGKTFEDAHFIIPYLTEIDKAVFDMSPKYYYVHRGGTITTSPFKRGDLSIVEAYSKNQRIIESRYPDLLKLAQFRYYWSLFYVIDKMMGSKSYGYDGEYKAIMKGIRREYFHILSNPYVGRARKVAATGLMLHKRFYELCLRAYIHKNKQLVVDEKEL